MHVGTIVSCIENVFLFCSDFHAAIELLCSVHELYYVINNLLHFCGQQINSIAEQRI